MNGLYFIPILAVMVMGMFSDRTPAEAANAALIAGFAVIALGYFVPRYAGLVEAVGTFHFLGSVFALLVLTMAVWGR